MSRPVEATIDGLKVSTTRHALMRGQQLRAKLLRLVTPAVSALFSGGVKNLGAIKDLDLEDEADASQIAPALEKLAEKLDPETLPALYVEILCNTSMIVPVGEPPTLARVDLNSPEKLDLAFEDRSEITFYKVVAHALKVNFADPFAVLAAMAKAAAAKKAKPAETPTPSA